MFNYLQHFFQNKSGAEKKYWGWVDENAKNLLQYLSSPRSSEGKQHKQHGTLALFLGLCILQNLAPCQPLGTQFNVALCCAC